MMKFVLSTSNRQYCRNCYHCHQNLDYDLIEAKVATTKPILHLWKELERHNQLYNFCSHCLKCAMFIPKPPALPQWAPANSQALPVLAPALPQLAPVLPPVLPEFEPAISQPIPVLAPSLPELAKCELLENKLKLEAKKRLSLEATVAKLKVEIKHLGAEKDALLVENCSFKEGQGELILAECGELSQTSRKRKAMPLVESNPSKKLKSSFQSHPCNCLKPQRPRLNPKTKSYPNVMHAQLGAFESIDSALDFYSVALKTNAVKVHLVYHCETEFEGCDNPPHIISFSPKVKVSVIMKFQNCPNHPFAVISVIQHRFLAPRNAATVEGRLRKGYLPKMKKGTRGKTFTRTQAPSTVNKVSTEQGKVRRKRKVKPCTCKDHQKIGYTTTFGCTKSKLFGEICKYVKRPVGEGRQRFALYGKKDVPKFKFFFIALAQLASKNMSKIAPTAFSNMTKHIQPANKCRLGQSLFSGGTVLADGMVHGHFDPLDFCLGASSIYSFSKPSHKPQLHVLNQYSLVAGGPPGIGFDLGSNSLLTEVSSIERHATTPLEFCNPKDPTRVGIVFFLHNAIQYPEHGELHYKPKSKPKKGTL